MLNSSSSYSTQRTGSSVKAAITFCFLVMITGIRILWVALSRSLSITVEWKRPLPEEAHRQMQLVSSNQTKVMSHPPSFFLQRRHGFLNSPSPACDLILNQMEHPPYGFCGPRFLIIGAMKVRPSSGRDQGRLMTDIMIGKEVQRYILLLWEPHF